MSKQNILIVFGIIALLVLGVMQWRNQRNEEVVNSMHGARDSKELLSMAARNEEVWRQASESLFKCSYKEASRLASEASSFQYEFQSLPDVEVKPGVKISAWFESQKTAFYSNVVLTFDQVVSNSVAMPERSDMFMEYYALFHYEVHELKNLYEARKFEVSAARVKAADKYVRIIFDPENSEAIPLLKSAMEAAWDSKYGRSLVWGKTIDVSEQNATWMIIKININSQGASYEVKGRYRHVMNVQVPEKLSVSFAVMRPKKVVTSWDNLQNITVSETAPGVISAGENEMYDRVSKVAADYQKKLFEQLSVKIKTFPKFEIFPGSDPGKITLLKNGVVDHEAALVLACIAPGKLLNEAAAASWNIQPPQRAELARVAIDNNITSMVAWVAGVIKVESEGDRQNIWKSLKEKPMYGSFEPLLVMLSRVSVNEKISILKACKGYLFDPKVLAVFVSLVNQPDLPGREDMVNLLLTECPHNMLESYFWLSADKDERLADMATEIIFRRDSRLGWKMMVQYFDKWTPSRKSSRLFNLHYNLREHGSEIMAMFKKAAGRDQAEQVRREALRILMYETADTPEGWKILEEVGRVEPDPEVAAKIKEALARAVNNARPEMAEAFLLKTILEGNAEQRKTAAGKYFRSGGDINAKLKTIVPVVPRFADEADFFEALLRGFSEQGMPHIKDYSVPELQTLVTMALAHKDNMVRYFGITLSNGVWHKGQAQYEPMLAKYMLTETNKWLLDQAKKYYEPMKKPAKN